MDTASFIALVFELVGGLGIFLLGMKNMSEGMQAVAGNSLRKMIGAVTNNRIFAIGVGTLVTCVVQSSSITTVLVVGFVNSGVMELSQAVGVIMGANIGTTDYWLDLGFEDRQVWATNVRRCGLRLSLLAGGSLALLGNVNYGT